MTQSSFSSSAPASFTTFPSCCEPLFDERIGSGTAERVKRPQLILDTLYASLRRSSAVAVSLRIEVAGETNVGMKRTHNEDVFSIIEESGLYIVADGMGGHASGEIASKWQ